jgi:hypothetical protein
MVAFLASDLARNITGQAINVCGGVQVHWGTRQRSSLSVDGEPEVDASVARIRPPARDDLAPRVEPHTVRAVHVQVPEA